MECILYIFMIFSKIVNDVKSGHRKQQTNVVSVKDVFDTLFEVINLIVQIMGKREALDEELLILRAVVVLEI